MGGQCSVLALTGISLSCPSIQTLFFFEVVKSLANVSEAALTHGGPDPQHWQRRTVGVRGIAVGSSLWRLALLQNSLLQSLGMCLRPSSPEFAAILLCVRQQSQSFLDEQLVGRWGANNAKSCRLEENKATLRCRICFSIRILLALVKVVASCDPRVLQCVLLGDVGALCRRNGWARCEWRALWNKGGVPLFDAHQVCFGSCQSNGTEVWDTSSVANSWLQHQIADEQRFGVGIRRAMRLASLSSGRQFTSQQREPDIATKVFE